VNKSYAWNLYWNATVGSADDADNLFRLVDDVRTGTVNAAEQRRVENVERGAHILERLVEGVRLTGAGVQHAGTQPHPGQQRPVSVYVVDGEEHRFQPLDPTVLRTVIASRSPIAYGISVEMSTE